VPVVVALRCAEPAAGLLGLASRLARVVAVAMLPPELSRLMPAAISGLIWPAWYREKLASMFFLRASAV